MLPSLTGTNCAKVANRASSEQFYDALVGEAARTKMPRPGYIGIAQDCYRRILSSKFALHGSASTLLNHVVHVLFVRTELQVVRAHAERSIAGVHHLKAIWDWSIRKLEGHAVRCTGASLKADAAVSHSLLSTSPEPAGVGFADARPEKQVGSVGGIVFSACVSHKGSISLKSLTLNRMEA